MKNTAVLPILLISILTLTSCSSTTQNPDKETNKPTSSSQTPTTTPTTASTEETNSETNTENLEKFMTSLTEGTIEGYGPPISNNLQEIATKFEHCINLEPITKYNWYLHSYTISADEVADDLTQGNITEKQKNEILAWYEKEVTNWSETIRINNDSDYSLVHSDRDNNCMTSLTITKNAFGKTDNNTYLIDFIIG